MESSKSDEGEDVARRRDELLRRALATPPLSNEDILKRSKESRAK